MKLLIFILFNTVIYANASVIPIIFEITHPETEHVIYTLGTYHGGDKVQLKYFPDYIQKLPILIDRLFVERTIVMGFEQQDLIRGFLAIQEAEVVKLEIIKSLLNQFNQNFNALSNIFRNGNQSETLALDHELFLLSLYTGKPTHALDTDIISGNNKFAFNLDNLIKSTPQPLKWLIRKNKDRLSRKILPNFYKSLCLALLKEYRNGNLDKLSKKSNDIEEFIKFLKLDQAADDAQSNKNMPIRESKWIDIILSELEKVDPNKPHTIMVAAGALHFITGENRLLTMFKEKGWIVKQLNPNNPNDLQNLQNMIDEKQSAILSNSDIDEVETSFRLEIE